MVSAAPVDRVKGLVCFPILCPMKYQTSPLHIFIHSLVMTTWELRLWGWLCPGLAQNEQVLGLRPGQVLSRCSKIPDRRENSRVVSRLYQSKPPGVHARNVCQVVSKMCLIHEDSEGATTRPPSTIKSSLTRFLRSSPQHSTLFHVTNLPVLVSTSQTRTRRWKPP